MTTAPPGRRRVTSPGEDALGVKQVLEDVAGEDGVEELVAQVRRVEAPEVTLDDPVEARPRLAGRPGVEFHAHDLARAGLLEERPVVAAAAAEVEHAQAARVDQLQERRLGVAEVASRDGASRGGSALFHRRIIHAPGGPATDQGSGRVTLLGSVPASSSRTMVGSPP